MGGQGSGRPPNYVKRLAEQKMPIASGGGDPLFLPNYSGLKKSITTDVLHLDPYKIEDVEGSLIIKNTKSGEDSIVGITSKDADGTDPVAFVIGGKADFDTFENIEIMQSNWEPEQLQYQIQTFKNGTGTARPLNIFTSGNENQLFLAVNGAIGIGTTTPSAKLDVECSSGGAVTIGASSNVATGNFASSFGRNCTASGHYSLAIGDECTASGLSSVSWGNRNTASLDASTAFGSDTEASGINSFTAGALSKASGYNSFSLGNNCEASGTSSVVFGRELKVSGDYSFGIALNDQNGAEITADNTMAIMGGKVGIGILSPVKELEVAGTISGASLIAGDGFTGTGAYTNFTIVNGIITNAS